MARQHIVDLVHGTTSGYVTFKCRCLDCRKAWSDYMASFRAASGARFDRLYNKAASRARQRVIDAHRQEYDRYLSEEKTVLYETHLSRPA